MLDLGELVVDPDLATVFTVVRREQIVGQNGIVQTNDTTIPDVGGVVTSQGNPLVQQPDYSHAVDNITILTQMKLYDPTNGYQPDKVFWDGSWYMVNKVGAWGQFGFYQVDCDLLDLTSSQ